MRSWGCLGCSPLVAGAILVLIGLAFQTQWAGDAAVALLRAIGWLLVVLGALVLVAMVIAWWRGFRGP